jgi:phosphatidylserine/phosphatidylglycerophosphate/cardiolipin synthase-like enzyme
MEDTIVAYINKAEQTLDMCVYDNRSNAIITAVNQAYLRGVTVRFISETTSLNSSLADLNSSIALIKRDDGTDIMHNKFVIIDRDSENNAWLITGSANHTPDNLTVDPNNMVFIQDKQLALAYTTEFEEMWGSDNDTPNAANSKFGSDKTDNTPHKFNINGSDVELYFDPSDNANKHIGDALNSSTSSINVAMLTFTKNDLAQILVNKNNDGNKVHVIVDNNTDTGNQFNFMKDNGVDVLLKGDAVSGFLHHKYAVIDADKFDADQIVITGSHNWTNAANTSNNENTLIIHSKRIANLYLQEFKARYIEAGGKDLITDTKEENDSQLPVNFELYQNYPNPFNPTTTIKYSIPAAASNLEMSAQNVTLKIFDMLGREIATLVNGYKSPGNYVVTFNASGLSSGIYFYQLRSGSYILTNKMMILK